MTAVDRDAEFKKYRDRAKEYAVKAQEAEAKGDEEKAGKLYKLAYDALEEAMVNYSAEPPKD
jgi:uncharacterized membrane protein (DUF106 family)